MALFLRYLMSLIIVLRLTDPRRVAIMVAERAKFITSGLYAEHLRTSDDNLLFYPLALATHALSLATNSVSTLMIAYKAW